MDAQQLRIRASDAVAKLAAKADERGTDKSGNQGTGLKPGWVIGGDDFGPPVKPALLQEAIGFYDIAIELNPSAAFYYQRALVFEKLSDFSSAVESFEMAFENEPLYRTHYGFLLERCNAKLSGAYPPGDAMARGMDALLGKALSGTPGLKSVLNWAMRDTKKAATAQHFVNRPNSREMQFSKEKSDFLDPHRVLVEFAESFVEALVGRNFDRAYTMISEALQKEYPPTKLAEAFDEMMCGADMGSADISAEPPMDNWPSRAADERLWVYVSVQAEDMLEAVTVIIAERGGALFINSIEWGRP